MLATPHILAVDIGGTFTDLVILDETLKRVFVSKVLTSYPDPSEAVLSGMEHLLAASDIAPEDVYRVLHGTTLVTNALIERKGAHTALITTEGFRDALEIAREGRYDIYDLGLVLPAPLVERRDRLEVPERMDSKGAVIEPLDDSALRVVCQDLLKKNVETIAITFLHAYANAEHERRAAEAVHQMLPETPLSLSHEVAPELREYERTSTTVANAYVKPLTQRYLAGLESGLQTAGLQAPLLIMLSNGGTSSVETAAAFPIRLVESGPAGGALAGAYWGRSAGFDDVLAFDMGGTTAKAILGSQGYFPITTEAEVARVHRFKRGSGLPLLVPVLDMIEIGAGGGSIAHLNELGLPVVGPESAGSVPGPACYGLGGTEPTVTDADLLLGYLNPNYFVGGAMTLDMPAAEAAIEDLAVSLDMTAVRLAWGIHQLVNENMAGAARVHAAERGLDIRRYSMVATGGAGPVHACGVAQRLGIRTVVVPPIAGVGSAFGMLLAPISFDFARSYVAPLDELDLDILSTLYHEMEAEGRRIVSAAGVPEGDIQTDRTADLRYAGQGHEIRIRVPPGALKAAARQQLLSAFNDEYVRIYGRLCEGVPVQTVHWRVTVSGPRPILEHVKFQHGEDIRGVQDLKGMRLAVFHPDDGSVEVPVFDRYALTETFQVDGPAIIEEAESTTIVPPGWDGQADAEGNLILRDTR